MTTTIQKPSIGRAVHVFAHKNDEAPAVGVVVGLRKDEPWVVMVQRSDVWADGSRLKLCVHRSASLAEVQRLRLATLGAVLALWDYPDVVRDTVEVP